MIVPEGSANYTKHIQITSEYINRLIGMRKGYGVTGRHPGFKRYRK